MLRRTLTILSLIGLLLSVGAWGAQSFETVLIHLTKFPESEFVDLAYELGPPTLEWPEQGVPGGSGRSSGAWPRTKPGWTQSSGPVYYVVLHGGHLRVGLGAEKLTIYGDQSAENLDVAFSYMRIYSRHHSIPLWSLALLFLTISCFLILVPLYRRRKLKKLGLCMTCGYDLRASEGRCPECGLEFEKA